MPREEHWLGAFCVRGATDVRVMDARDSMAGAGQGKEMVHLQFVGVRAGEGRGVGGVGSLLEQLKYCVE